MPISQDRHPSQPYPKLHHVALDTTFCGINHSTSALDTPIHQYLGIKYASIPARFRQSRLFNSFPAITDASSHGPICPQSQECKTTEEMLFGISQADVPFQDLKHDELECLNLNITCPAGLTVHSRLPVMVWIHGGGDRGSGSSWIYDGGPIVRKSIEIGKPVILVSLNFRIGLLGFACSPAIHEDNAENGDEGSSNYGLRDQRRALEWIRHYIQEFGGDPENVTLFGESSGAMDIVYQLLSGANETQPLFHRAIIQSAVIESYLPDVASAGWHLSRIMSALHVSTVDELRAVDVKKLTAMHSMHRAIDDGVFFRKDWKSYFNLEDPPPPRPHRSEKENTLLKGVVSRRHPSRSRSRLRSLRSSSRTPVPSTTKLQLNNLQPLIIGDCCSDSLLWSVPMSSWTAPAVVRRLKAVTQSLAKANGVLRAFEISSCTLDDELADRLLELVNDARVAWPTDIIAGNSKRERGGHNVWRYVFDQEGPTRGVPHHAADLIYLFDNVPLPEIRSTTPASTGEIYCDGPFDDDDDEIEVERRSWDSMSEEEWETYVVDQFSYLRVKDTIQEKWIAFANGESPWHEDKVFVFGPEGETGERSNCIFEGRRRRQLWKELFEPLGMQLVQKVGAELSRGP